MSSQFDILIVEDEQVIIDAAKKILIPEGYKIDDALDTETALKKLQQNNYKIILSDLMLPHISGIELLEKVKIKNAHIPIIMITGYATIENAVKSFKMGAFDFIPKPFDIDELLGVVYRALKYMEMKQEPTNKDKRFPLLKGKEQNNNKAEQYFFLGEHSWAKYDRDGVIMVGVGATFAGKLGKIEQIEFPAIDTEILQGNMCVRFISQQQLIHNVWIPISGKVIGINHKIKENYKLIDTDPYDQGWLVKIIPTNLQNESENLTQHQL